MGRTRSIAWMIPLAALAMGAMLSASTFAASSSQVTVQLPYNRQVFANAPTEEPPTCTKYDPAPAKDDCVPAFDLDGDALPAASAPKGTVTETTSDGASVQFQFPAVTGKDSVSLGPTQSVSGIPVTPGTYSELDLIGAAGNGPADLSFTFKYSDGTTSTQTLSLPDWYKGVPAFAIPFPGRWTPPVTSATLQTGHLGLYALSVPVTSSKTLESISIQNTGAPTLSTGAQNMAVANILAATLQGTATGTAPTAAQVASATFATGSTAASSTTTSSSSSTPTSTTSSSTSTAKKVPTTGASWLLFIEGGALVLVGAASAIALRARRS